MSASICGYSAVPNEALVQRCLSRRKPFKMSGEGFRDALIWETIVRDVACHDASTYLITDNVKDFADPHDKSRLHPELVTDLVARGLEPESVQICSSLDDFVKSH